MSRFRVWHFLSRQSESAIIVTSHNLMHFHAISWSDIWQLIWSEIDILPALQYVIYQEEAIHKWLDSIYQKTKLVAQRRPPRCWWRIRVIDEEVDAVEDLEVVDEASIIGHWQTMHINWRRSLWLMTRRQRIPKVEDTHIPPTSRGVTSSSK